MYDFSAQASEEMTNSMFAIRCLSRAARNRLSSNYRFADCFGHLLVKQYVEDGRRRRGPGGAHRVRYVRPGFFRMNESGSAPGDRDGYRPVHRPRGIV